jgi:hypothetical protein
MFSPSTKNTPNYYDSLSKKIFMCQKSMGYENISMPKCMRKRKHAKEHDAYKKRERENNGHLDARPERKTTSTLMPTSENKVAHTLKSTFNIRESHDQRSTKEINKIKILHTCTILI